MKAKERSKQAIASILISAATTGVASATIGFDFDVNPAMRIRQPDFYGYIPDGASRTVVFGCMTLNSALLLLSRSFCAALLMLVEKKYFLLYAAGDMGLYFLQKVLRGDLWYWLPLDGWFDVLFSILIRLLVKVIADYTGLLQFRGSAELGGIYFSANLIMAVVAPFLAIKIYYAKIKPADFVMEEKTAWLIAGSLGGAWLSFFLLFLALIKNKYRRTFFSWETGFEWAQNFFLRGETDEVKSALVGCNRKQWKAIEEDVKVWVLESWEGWEEEKPGFFTENFRASLDDDWLTPVELRRQKMAGGGQRRRSSLGELIGGNVRERRGSATVVPFNEGVDVVGDDDEAAAPEPTIARLPEESAAENEEGKMKAGKKKKGKRYEDDSDDSE
jgi:hypothetical protein